MLISCLRALCRAAALALIAVTAQAAPYAVDQHNDTLPYSGGFMLNAGPIGESFVPTLSALNVVDLLINDQNPGFGTGVHVAVNILSGGIGGAVLGTSLPVLFHDQAPMPFQTPESIRFTFAAAVSLVPGATYVLQPFAIRDTGDGSDIGVFGTGYNVDGYVPGVSYFRGAVFTGASAPFDLWFREGLADVPEPATASLLLGTVLLLAVRRPATPA